ncbi:MAG: hypothetical protein ABI871_02715 [Chthoniobacterales bacterium]
MKISLSLALLGALFSSSCTDFDEPPVRSRRSASTYSNAPREPQQYPPEQQPFTPGATPPPGPATEDSFREEPGTSTQAPVAAPEKIVKGDYPYGVPVPGKPGFVKSPFSPDKLTDVRGIPPGTPVKDPYTEKVFLVP